MSRSYIFVAVFVVSVLPAVVSAGPVEFQLITHGDNVQWLPQPSGELTVSGDHLLRTADDITGGTFNPDGCFSFNFMNPVGLQEPNYPPGYAEGIHSMTGSVVLDVDLQAGGLVDILSLAFDGYVAPSKLDSHQRLISPGDTAADGNHGPVDGQPNSGSYVASAAANWAFTASFDWYYDTQFGGGGTIDMTFDNYQWSGFIIPASELTLAGLAAATLDDPLGYFGGGSEDFESWLLTELVGRLPQDAQWLLFAQAEAHPAWTHELMGMTTDGIVGQTVIAYTVPEPTSILLFLAGFWACGRLSGINRGQLMHR